LVSDELSEERLRLFAPVGAQVLTDNLTGDFPLEIEDQVLEQEANEFFHSSSFSGSG
jgi:hypothetical protein